MASTPSYMHNISRWCSLLVHLFPLGIFFSSTQAEWSGDLYIRIALTLSTTASNRISTTVVQRSAQALRKRTPTTLYSHISIHN